METLMDITRIIIDETSDSQVVVLKERGGKRVIPMTIGSFEAFALNRAVKGASMPRPMTHDLIASTISGLGGQVAKMVINELMDQTFFANLVVRIGGRTMEIDCRPSDAMVLCLLARAPIFAEEAVLDEGSEP